MKQLLYFSAQWCEPCKQLGPLMSELQSEGYAMQKIDVDSNPEMCQKYSVKNIPTVVLTVNGEDRSRKLGFNSKSTYIDMYNQN